MFRLFAFAACASPSPLGPLLADNAEFLAQGALAISDRRVDTAQLAQLLDAPEVPVLLTIRASGNRLDGGAGRVLAGHAKTMGLTSLQLDANPGFGPDGVRALGAAPFLSTLRDLSVTGTGADGPAVATLASASALRSLDASFNPVDDAAVPALLGLRALERLRLRETRLSGAGARALLEKTAVALLDLSGTPLGAGALDGLGGVSPSLRSLDLSGAGLGPRDAVVLAQSALSLESLDLAGDPIGDVGVEALAGAPWLAHLTALDASGTGASALALDHLRAAWGHRRGLTL
jgi:hypothetical protein